MRNRSILILDDDLCVASYVRDIAESLDYEARVTSDSPNFMALYNKLHPDIVVLDICMPEQDGIEVMRKLANAKCMAHVLFISGSDQFYLTSTQKLARDFGLQNVSTMPKPLRLDVLRAFLSNPVPMVEPPKMARAAAL